MTGESLAGQPEPTIVIKPHSGWRALDLRELWEYRDLLLIFTWRDLKVRYRQTFLGALWVLGQPLITMLIFTFLFNRIAKLNGPAGVPYPVFVLAGVLLWNFFANGVTKASNSLIGSSFLISKIYFPRLLIPLSATAVEVVDLCVASLLLAFMMLFYGLVPAATALFLPVIVILAALLSVGVGLWGAALSVEYRDLRLLIPFLLQIGMYVTPVIYPIDVVPAKYRPFVYANPMTGIVEGFRALLFGSAVPMTALAISTASTLAILISGLYTFRRMERLFADVL